MRLDLRMASASSWQGSLVTPGGAPAPPECWIANPARRRRTLLRHQERLRTAPLIEQGDLGILCYRNFVKSLRNPSSQLGVPRRLTALL